MTLAFVIVAGRKNDLHVSLRGFRPSGRIIRDIYAVGAPSIIMQGIGTVLAVFMNAILIGLTSTAVAVFGAYFKVQSFLLMPMMGMMNASLSIEAYNYGARNRRRLMRAWRMTLYIGIIMMLVGTVGIWLLSHQIMALFNATDAMHEIGMAALRIMSSCLPFAVVSISISTVFQAVGRGVYSMIHSLLRQIVVLLPAAWLLARITGQVNAVWFSFPIAEAAALIISACLMARVYRRHIRPLDHAAKNLSAG